MSLAVLAAAAFTVATASVFLRRRPTPPPGCRQPIQGRTADVIFIDDVTPSLADRQSYMTNHERLIHIRAQLRLLDTPDAHDALAHLDALYRDLVDLESQIV